MLAPPTWGGSLGRGGAAVTEDLFYGAPLAGFTGGRGPDGGGYFRGRGGYACREVHQ